MYAVGALGNLSILGLYVLTRMGVSCLALIESVEQVGIVDVVAKQPSCWQWRLAVLLTKTRPSEVKSYRSWGAAGSTECEGEAFLQQWPWRPGLWPCCPLGEPCLFRLPNVGHRAIVYLHGRRRQAPPLSLVWSERLPTGRRAGFPLAYRSAGWISHDRGAGAPISGGDCNPGLITTSAVIVQFSGGYIEAHFHFFVMLAVISPSGLVSIPPRHPFCGCRPRRGRYVVSHATYNNPTPSPTPGSGHSFMPLSFLRR